MADDKIIDKAALAKTFGVLLLSVMFLVTYAGNLSVCNGTEDGSQFNPMKGTDSTCRMNIYGGLADDGPVKIWYYLFIWGGIMALSFLGFFILLCNCNMCAVRIYSFGLFGAAVLLAIAEVISIMKTLDFFKNGYTNEADGTVAGRENWRALSAQNNGLNSCVMVMEVIILVNTAVDAFFGEYATTG
jgi:hypothetical protein